MKNNKGITLIALTITIIVLLILAGITLNYGTESLRKAQLETLKTNMMLIKAKTMECVEQANFKAGKNVDVTEEVKAELKGTEIENTYDYITLNEKQYLYNINDLLQEFGLKDVKIDTSKDEKYLVVYDITNANVEIYNTIGFEVNGNIDKVYDRILGYKETFTSAGAAEDISQASVVSINAKVEENSYYDTRTKEIRNGYQFSGSFLNNKRKDEDEGANFEIQGVVGKMKDEYDRDGNETGRLLISFIVIGYKGKANVIELVAEGSKKEFISSHWEEGDTVIVTGKVISSYKTIVTYEEQGFGDPIKRTRTVGRRELLVTGGSPSGASEEFSYSADDIKIALQRRSSDMEAMKEKAQNQAKVKTKTSGSFLDDF